MNRLLLTVTLALLAATAASAQSGTPARPNGNPFNGYVRTARVEVAYYVKQDGVLVEGPRRLTATYAYSEDGKKGEYEVYAPDGTLRQRSVSVYDDAGRMIEHELYDGSGNLIAKVVHRHDEGEVLHYDGEGSLKLRVVTEKRDGVTEVRSYDASGALTGRTVTERGEGSISTKTYDGDGVLLDENSVRGANGTFVSKWQSYDADGSPGDRTTSTAAAGSNRYDMVVEKPDGTPPQRRRETNERDARGNLAKSITYVWSDAARDYVPQQVIYYTLTYYR